MQKMFVYKISARVWSLKTFLQSKCVSDHQNNERNCQKIQIILREKREQITRVMNVKVIRSNTTFESSFDSPI